MCPVRSIFPRKEVSVGWKVPEATGSNKCQPGWVFTMVDRQFRHALNEGAISEYWHHDTLTGPRLPPPDCLLMQ